MQSVSSSIWTCVAMSISYDDNHYTTGTSFSQGSPLTVCLFYPNFICKYIDSMFIIFTNPSARAGYDTKLIFKWSLTGLNSQFSFYTSWLTEAEEPLRHGHLRYILAAIWLCEIIYVKNSYLKILFTNDYFLLVETIELLKIHETIELCANYWYLIGIRGEFNKFPDFFVQEFKTDVDSWKFSMLLLYILWDDWPMFMISGSN